MSFDRRKILFIACASLVLMLLPALGLVFQEAHGPKQTLPDGTTLELIAVTPPDRDSVAVGSLWARDVRPWLLARIPLWRPSVRFTDYGEPWDAPTLEDGRARLRNDAGHVALWFRVRHSAPSILAATMPIATATEDSHGCRLQNRSGTASNYERMPIPEIGTGRPSGAIGVARLFSYPRREARFDFLVLSADRSTVLARFPVVNPTSRSFWDTSGNAMPLTCRKDGYAFRLLHIAKADSGRHAGQVRARFRVERDGCLAAHWVPDSVEVRDNTGNSVESAVQRDGEDYWFDGLCVREPAWRFGVGFVKRDPDRDPPDYTWEIRDLPAPAGGWTSCERSVSSPEALLRILAVRNAADAGKFTQRSMQPVLHVQFGTPAPVSVRVISVTDDLGKNLVLSGHGSSQEVLREAELPLPALRRARHWNIVLGAYIRREADFFVHP